MSSCEPVRAALSAAIDGEAAPVGPAAVRDHLDGCAACTAFARELPRLARRTRLSVADEVPDLTERIVEAVAGDRSGPASPERSRRGAEAAGQRRAVLALAGVAQLLLAVPSLVGDGGHLARDVAASEIALAAVFLFAAWRPAVSAGLAVVATVFATAGIAASVAAVADGASLWSEASHLVPVVGAAVLWSLAPRRPEDGVHHRRAAVGRG